MHPAVRSDRHAQRPPASLLDLRPHVVAAVIVCADAKIRGVRPLLAVLLALEINQQARPIGVRIVPFLFRQRINRIERQAEGKGRSTALLPLFKRRHVDPHHDTGTSRRMDRTPHLVHHIGDEVILLSAIAGHAGNSRVERTQYQRTAAALQTPSRRRNTLDVVRMAPLLAFIPTPVGRLAHRIPPLLVNILGALRPVVHKLPLRILKIVAYVLQHATGAGY